MTLEVGDVMHSILPQISKQNGSGEGLIFKKNQQGNPKGRGGGDANILGEISFFHFHFLIFSYHGD